MPATAVVKFLNAGTDGSPVKTAVSGGPPDLRFRTDDSPNTKDSTNPIPIPTTGFNYSFWMHVALELTTFTQISNIRHYTDGTIAWTMGTGGLVVRGARNTGDVGVADVDYDVATGTVGTTGDSIDHATLGHGFFLGQTPVTVNLALDTSGAPATIDSSTYATSPITSKAICMQVKVFTDATQGNQADETFTWIYNEI